MKKKTNTRAGVKKLKSKKTSKKKSSAKTTEVKKENQETEKFVFINKVSLLNDPRLL